MIGVLRDLRRSLSRAAAAIFARTGVGPKQVLVMRELARLGSTSQVDLALGTATDPAALMRAIDALERRGWVRRAGCTDDRRKKLVSLTPEGRREVGALDEAYESLRALLDEGLTAAERKQFCAIAAKLIARMNEAGADAPADDQP